MRPLFKYLIALTLFNIANLFAFPAGLDTSLFVSEQVLSRPTATSVTVSIVPKKVMQIYFEYGTAPSVYSYQTVTRSSVPDTPLRYEISGLTPNSRWFYRIRYKESGNTQFLSGPECTFHTQRAKGSSFKFDLMSDSHLYDKKGNSSAMKVTLQNIKNDTTDFVMDLGDTFGDDRNPPTMTQQQMMKLHLNYLPYIGMAANSSPFFFCLGNHEGENGYFLIQTPPDNLAIWGTLARKFYYANPVPDQFYTGNQNVEGYGIGQPENYYAWTWGDAQFIVLDAYRYSFASASSGNWDWTLGQEQYNWFKQTLENSTSKYKFVFAHHVRGWGRGGIIPAKYFEWGGRNLDSSWGFSTNRPGWAAPVHQLMVNHGVNIFFQGHDHLFAQEILDGVVYQEIPMPSDSTYEIGMLANADAYTSVKVRGTGHIRVTVDSDSAKVEFVSAWLPADTNSIFHNGAVAFSYKVAPNPVSVKESHEMPTTMKLDQNYPNPFSAPSAGGTPETVIGFSVPEAGHVTLKVYDILGRTVSILADEYKEAGHYKYQFRLTSEERDGMNTGFSSGVYIYQLKMNSTVLTKKAIFIK